MDILTEKRNRLDALLRAAGRVAVGFSGGVDSTLLLRLAIDALGPGNVLAVVADTPTLPRREYEAARLLAASFGATCLTIHPGELDDPDFLANAPDRCYFCKHHLFEEIARVAAERGFARVLDGNNADDAGDYRPGRRAAQELGVQSPLMEAGLTKAEIRVLSRQLGLPTADKPAMACLASRIPYGTPVTTAALAQVERAESFLRDAGFTVCRVRHHGDVARIELAPEELPRACAAPMREHLARGIQAAGYRYAALDLLGYRMGSLNEVLAPTEKDA